MVLVRLLQTAPEFTHEYAHLTVLVVTSLLLLPSCSLLIGVVQLARDALLGSHIHACTAEPSSVYCDDKWGCSTTHCLLDVTVVPPTHAHHVVSFALSSSSLRCGCSCVVVPPYTDTPGLEPFLCVFSYDFYVFVYVLLFLSRCAASLLLT